jgi:glycosyltransferase involved in cell wall biosynthesis
VNRILSLAEGLQIAGDRPSIYGFTPLHNKVHPSNGEIKSIIYSYPVFVSNNYYVRAILSFLELLYRFPSFVKKNKIDIIYLYNIPLIAKWIILSYKLFFSYKVVEENNEYPFILLRQKKIQKRFGRLYKIYAYRFLDGMVVITKSLKLYYTPLTSRKTKFEIINMTVNVNRFINIPDKNLPYSNYFAYCGSFSQLKDGVIILIQAFSNILKVHPEMRLLIIGNGSMDENKVIHEKVCNLMIQDKVILTGSLPSEEIPVYLLKARGLVLPRPRSFQAEGGFPTKLGEYLATGNPVIATKVGEIPDFLIDGINAYLADPDSIESLSEKMMELLGDLERAKKIGNERRKLTEREFNYIVQSQRLSDFLNNLNLLEGS